MFKRAAQPAAPTKMVPTPAGLVAERYSQLERCYVALRLHDEAPMEALRSAIYVVYDRSDAESVIAFLDGELDAHYDLPSSGTELREIVTRQCEETFSAVAAAS